MDRQYNIKFPLASYFLWNSHSFFQSAWLALYLNGEKKQQMNTNTNLCKLAMYKKLAPFRQMTTNGRFSRQKSVIIWKRLDYKQKS